MKFKQIVSAPWKGQQGLIYTLYGLSEDGDVYRYKPGGDTWIRMGINVSGPSPRDPGTPNASAATATAPDKDDIPF